MLAKKDPYAVNLLHQFHDVAMPNQGSAPPTSTTSSIIWKLPRRVQRRSSLHRQPRPRASPPSKVTLRLGKDLFTGVVRYQNGGPPCMACHSTGGIGALGGGQLGPDLTTVVARLGGVAGVDAFVAGTPTPTMKAVWSKHPLTTEERANVVSFLAARRA